MQQGNLPTVAENALSPRNLPLPAGAHCLSPVGSTGNHSYKEYQSRKLEVRLISGLLGSVTLLSIVLTGMSDAFASAWSLATSIDSLVLLGVFFSIGVCLFIVRAPFAWYSGRVLERAYGLLTQSLSSWLMDIVKGAVVGGVLATVVLLVLYESILRFHTLWWLPLGSFIFILQLILAYLGPRFILPLFYTLTPLEDVRLRERIEGICKRAGIRSDGIFVIGFGAKTKKANAALTGLGSSKRIVLSDTLIQNLTDEEVEGVFAHEVGHQKLGHIWYGIGSGVLTSFMSLFIVSVLYEGAVRSLSAAPSDIAMMPLLGVLIALVSFFLGPLTLALSRWQEYAADKYASDMTRNPGALGNALEKIGRINLADPDPHPMLELFTFSHPSLRKRIFRLGEQA
jgi:STE24 endopeptidase